MTSNYSNRCLEYFNHKIKQIKRIAFDYANFHNLPARIRLEKSGKRKRTKQVVSCLVLFLYSLSTIFDKDHLIKN
ncbi:transposase [Lactobacillus sp. M0396]|uniref:transposase n=1 Tax=Lactobacillus sp. M0396 TaxID=2751030 RepID=UPI0018DC70A6|nr:transposase [Lactobacillus sp. M0396]